MTAKAVSTQESQSRAARLAEMLDDLKALDIAVLDLRGIADFTDFFVIATMRSATQMHAAAQQVHDRMKVEGIRPFVPPEIESSLWTVIDYGNVVVHLFEAKAREHYALETLWGDAEILDWHDRATA